MFTKEQEKKIQAGGYRQVKAGRDPFQTLTRFIVEHFEGPRQDLYKEVDGKSIRIGSMSVPAFG